MLVVFTLLAALALGTVACGSDSGEADEAAQYQEEIQTLDSLSSGLDSLTETLETETQALQNALEDLETLEE